MFFGYILCIIIGALITYLFNRLYLSNGILKIDKSNPDIDTYRLCIIDLNKLERRKYLFLKIDKHANLTQK